MARKSRKAKSSKKARAGASDVKKSSAEESGTSEPVSTELPTPVAAEPAPPEAPSEDAPVDRTIDPPPEPAEKTPAKRASKKPAAKKAAAKKPARKKPAGKRGAATGEGEAEAATEAEGPTEPEAASEPKVEAEPEVEVESAEPEAASDPEIASEPALSSELLPEPAASGQPRQEPGSRPEPEPTGKKKKRKKRRGKKAKAEAREAARRIEPVAPPADAPEPARVSLDDDLDGDAEPARVSLDDDLDGDAEPVAVSIDDDLDEDTELVALSLDEDGEEESDVVTFSLDDDLDDHEARERLIAEALAFVAAEEGGPSPTITPAGAPGADPEEAGPAASLDAGDTDAADLVEGEDARPRLTPDALLALSEMRAQGIALPGELILDLGEATTPQERDRILAAAMAHAEMQEAIYRIPVATRRDTWIKLGITSVILFMALVVGIWPPSVLVPEPPPTLTGQDAVHGVRVTLLLQAQQIEAFRVNADRLPVSLEEAGWAFAGVRYVRSGSRLYQLVAYRPDGEPVIYDSAAPAPEFQALARRWLPDGDDS